MDLDCRKKKKSKKSSKDHERRQEEKAGDTAQGSSAFASEGVAPLPPCQPVKTAAEIAFLRKREKLDAERIRQKASVSHKERVSKFNEYLDSLSEHYEQAKVSWTK